MAVLAEIWSGPDLHPIAGRVLLSCNYAWEGKMKMARALENGLQSALPAMILTLNSVGCTQIYLWSSCDARLMVFRRFYIRWGFKFAKYMCVCNACVLSTVTACTIILWPIIVLLSWSCMAHLHVNLAYKAMFPNKTLSNNLTVKYHPPMH